MRKHRSQYFTYLNVIKLWSIRIFLQNFHALFYEAYNFKRDNLQILQPESHTHTRARARAHTYTHINTHTHTHKYTHTYTHALTHTHAKTNICIHAYESKS